MTLTNNNRFLWDDERQRIISIKYIKKSSDHCSVVPSLWFRTERYTIELKAPNIINPRDIKKYGFDFLTNNNPKLWISRKSGQVNFTVQTSWIKGMTFTIGGGTSYKTTLLFRGWRYRK